MNITSTLITIAAAAILIILLLLYIFIPIEISRENSNSFKAIVTRILAGGPQKKDISISFYNQNGTHFIRLGIEKGLNVDTLIKKILNKEVTVLYLKPGPLSRFSPIADTRYITEIRVGKDTIYTELK